MFYGYIIKGQSAVLQYNITRKTTEYIDEKRYPSIPTLKKEYGKSFIAYPQGTIFLIRSREEECWLREGSGHRETLLYRILHWDKVTVFTYKFKNGEEVVWHMLKYE